MPDIGTAFKIPFTVLTTAGADYTDDGTPPDVIVVQADMSHAASTHAAVRVAGALWYCALTGAEVASELVTVEWSGAGILSGSKSLLIGGLTSDQSDQLAEIYAKTSSATITVTSPVTGSSISIVKGDSYQASENRAFVFSSAGWPSLIGGSVVFSAGSVLSGVAGAILSASSVRVELTHAQTDTLDANKTYPFDIKATLSNGHVQTLVRGTLAVAPHVSP